MKTMTPMTRIPDQGVFPMAMVAIPPTVTAPAHGPTRVRRSLRSGQNAIAFM